MAALAGLLMLTGLPPARAETPPDGDKRGITNFLTENTLSYPSRAGEENLIHFGRFGNFDWYFPCEFESGAWSLGDDQILSLTYDNAKFASRRFKLEHREDGIALIEPDSETFTVATLLDGNHIPYF